MNRLFVVNKPIFRTSNGYMNHIKRKYNSKKVGFSGTLDPFATGSLIVAIGQYTKLFQYLNKTPKTYNATLWLGANSQTLDIEKIDSIKEIQEFDKDTIQEHLNKFLGDITYYPPKFSAKKIGGRRAYELAREGKEVNLKQISSTIYDIKLINYNHPFINFDATVSEGTYIRSLGSLIADSLSVDATLSSLKRINEGEFYFNDEKSINPFDKLALPNNTYTGDHNYLELGKKLNIEYFTNHNDGIYLIETDNFFSIIEVLDNQVKYKLNRIEKFEENDV